MDKEINHAKSQYDDWYGNYLLLPLFSAGIPSFLNPTTQSQIKPLIDQLYPSQNRWKFSIDVREDRSLYEQIDNKNIPDYQEIRERYPDKLRSIVDIYLFKDLNETNKDDELI